MTVTAPHHGAATAVWAAAVTAAAAAAVMRPSAMTASAARRPPPAHITASSRAHSKAVAAVLCDAGRCAASTRRRSRHERRRHHHGRARPDSFQPCGAHSEWLDFVEIAVLSCDGSVMWPLLPRAPIWNLRLDRVVISLHTVPTRCAALPLFQLPADQRRVPRCGVPADVEDNLSLALTPPALWRLDRPYRRPWRHLTLFFGRVRGAR